MPTETTSTAKIRFNDCDPLGHLNNARYIDYMLNAREDHVEENYSVSYQEMVAKTGCTFVTVMNEIAYLKEVRYGQTVEIASKIIELTGRTCKVEILMKHIATGQILAVMWTNVIWFDLKTRKSVPIPTEFNGIFQEFIFDVDQKEFKERADYLRRQNRN